jgi:hypothetical protein
VSPVVAYLLLFTCCTSGYWQGQVTKRGAGWSDSLVMETTQRGKIYFR